MKGRPCPHDEVRCPFCGADALHAPHAVVRHACPDPGCRGAHGWVLSVAGRFTPLADMARELGERHRPARRVRVAVGAAMTCGYCGSPRHTTGWCPLTWGGSARRMRGDRLRCTYCGAEGHNRDACPRAWPGPDPQVREP